MNRLALAAVALALAAPARAQDKPSASKQAQAVQAVSDTASIYDGTKAAGEKAAAVPARDSASKPSLTLQKGRPGPAKEERSDRLDGTDVQRENAAKAAAAMKGDDARRKSSRVGEAIVTLGTLAVILLALKGARRQPD